MKRSEKLLKLPMLVKNYPKMFLDYAAAVLSRKNFLSLYGLKDGTKLWISARGPDRGLLIQIWLNKVYTKFFDVEKDDIVVDIGAHVGIFTIYAARKAKKVISFEPALKNYNILKRNIKVNGFKNVEPRKIAIWNVRRKIDLFLQHNTSANSVFDKSDKKEEVRCITLSDIFTMEKLDRIDFIKIDSEKCELETILSTPRKIIRKIRKYAIECEDLPTRDKISAYMERSGFRTMYNPDEGYNHILFAIQT